MIAKVALIFAATWIGISIAILFLAKHDRLMGAATPRDPNRLRKKLLYAAGWPFTFVLPEILYHWDRRKWRQRPNKR